MYQEYTAEDVSNELEYAYSKAEELDNLMREALIFNNAKAYIEAYKLRVELAALIGKLEYLKTQF